MVQEISKEEYDRNFRSKLGVALSYFKHAFQVLECQAGNHEWDGWSSTMGGNVKQITEEPEKYKYSCRVCTNCGVEMPQSREGQENYLTYKDWVKRKYGWLVRVFREHDIKD